MPQNQTQPTSSTEVESLRKKSNRLFKYQQSHKSELPTPPTPRQRRQDRVQKSIQDRKNKVLTEHDTRRTLLAYGFSTNQTANTQTSLSTPAEQLEQLGELTNHSENINKEISLSLANIAETRTKFTNEIANVLQLNASQENLHEAVTKLCSLLQSSNDKILSLQESTQQSLLKILALQKDIEISNLRRDMQLASNSDRIQSIESKMACVGDLNKIWITFTCDRELEQLKANTNLIVEAKNILKRMDIDINKYGMLPIRTARLQHIKVEKNVIPTLCIAFTNDKIAPIVRRQIMKYNATLEAENRLSEMRYNERIFWSKDVFKLLKVCWELKRVNLVEFVNVHVEGIRVVYKTQKNGQSATDSINITNFSDLDILRRTVNDIFPETSTTILYDDDYFKLQFQERDERRSGEVFTDELADTDMEI